MKSIKVYLLKKNVFILSVISLFTAKTKKNFKVNIVYVC